MHLIESKARSKALFAVCHLELNSQSTRASDIAKISDQNPSNASRYCNEWCDVNVMRKDREGSYVSFHINKAQLSHLLFDYIGSSLEESLGYDSVLGLKEVPDEKIENMATMLAGEKQGEKTAHDILDKVEMAHYFLSRNLDRDSVFAEELGQKLQKLLSQPAVSTMEAAGEIIEKIKQLMGGQEVEVIEQVWSLTSTNEEPVRDAKTVEQALETSIDTLLFMRCAGDQQLSDDEREFLQNLRIYRTGFRLTL